MTRRMTKRYIIIGTESDDQTVVDMIEVFEKILLYMGDNAIVLDPEDNKMMVEILDRYTEGE